MHNFHQVKLLLLWDHHLASNIDVGMSLKCAFQEEKQLTEAVDQKASACLGYYKESN